MEYPQLGDCRQRSGRITTARTDKRGGPEVKSLSVPPGKRGDRSYCRDEPPARSVDCDSHRQDGRSIVPQVGGQPHNPGGRVVASPQRSIENYEPPAGGATSVGGNPKRIVAGAKRTGVSLDSGWIRIRVARDPAVDASEIFDLVKRDRSLERQDQARGHQQATGDQLHIRDNDSANGLLQWKLPSRLQAFPEP